jgi:hypothetical protein
MYKFKYPFALFLFLLLGVKAHSQDTLFYNTNWDRCTKTSAQYFRLISKTNKYEVKDYYYPSGVLQMEGTNADRKYKVH